MLFLGAAAWMVRLGWLDAPYWVLVAWAAALAARPRRGLWRGPARARLSLGGVAGRLEETGRLAPGHAHRAARPLGDRDQRRPARAGRPGPGGRRGPARSRGRRAARPAGARRSGWRGSVCLRLGLAAFGIGGAAARARGRAVASPRAPGRPPSPRCASARPASVVDRGDSTTLELEAFGRRTATLWLRAPGEGWRPRGVRLDSLGRATRHDRRAPERRLRPPHRRQPRRPTP